jgi:hypothetical protein
LHEYGHHLAHIFGFDDPTIGSNHRPDVADSCFKEPCGDLAWAEGVAHYLAGEMLIPPNEVHENTSINNSWTTRHSYDINLEDGVVTVLGGVTCQCNDEGWTWEVPVAGTLWDISDQHADNQNGDACGDEMWDGPNKIWDVLASHAGAKIKSIGDFYGLLCQRYAIGNTTYATQLDNVFCEHGMQTNGCGVVGVGEGGSGSLMAGLSVAPNPVLASTLITFVMPGGAETRRVRLCVYDLRGRLVKTLADGRFGQGEHSIGWDARGDQGTPMGAGVYFVKLSSEVGQGAARILVLR